MTELRFRNYYLELELLTMILHWSNLILTRMTKVEDVSDLTIELVQSVYRDGPIIWERISNVLLPAGDILGPNISQHLAPPFDAQRSTWHHFHSVKMRTAKRIIMADLAGCDDRLNWLDGKIPAQSVKKINIKFRQHLCASTPGKVDACVGDRLVFLKVRK